MILIAPLVAEVVERKIDNLLRAHDFRRISAVTLARSTVSGRNH